MIDIDKMKRTCSDWSGSFWMEERAFSFGRNHGDTEDDVNCTGNCASKEVFPVGCVDALVLFRVEPSGMISQGKFIDALAGDRIHRILHFDAAGAARPPGACYSAKIARCMRTSSPFSVHLATLCMLTS